MSRYKRNMRIIGAVALVGGFAFLVWPPKPTLEKQPEETAQHFEYRYNIDKAESYLYDDKYIGQRWRGENILEDIAENAPAPYNIKALTELFEFNRFSGLRRTEWMNRTWHEPLRRKYVEKASDAAIRLAKHAPEKASDLLSEFIIYPVTIPAIPAEAIGIVSTAAGNGSEQAIKAMYTYCTDERYWNPCTKEDTEKWTLRNKTLTE